MWLRLPKFRFLAYAINWLVMRNMTGLIYDRFVAPWLYRRYRASSGIFELDARDERDVDDGAAGDGSSQQRGSSTFS